ncbi:M15 family metallopeptidase [Streptomyces polyrhachis]|uniref:M15 family metallopeptidase n=1 Tax=Streptomyces polyrhachis TaxID=1282885 RepID=UPI0036DB4622
MTKIGDAQWARITAAGAWRPECPVGRAGLRRLELNYWGFDGKVHRGSLVVRDDVSASLVRVFTKLFEERFPIRRMEPIEAYGGDDNASMRADNTSAFNCRTQGQANAPSAKSPHANGRAVDINPMENPWIDSRCDCWQPSAQHSSRTPGPGKILKNGPVWRAFTEEGWIWQDIATADYQHFDTGFPSRLLGS